MVGRSGEWGNKQFGRFSETEHSSEHEKHNSDTKQEPEDNDEGSVNVGKQKQFKTKCHYSYLESKRIRCQVLFEYICHQDL